VMEVRGGERVKEEQARAKMALANDLQHQGEFEEALALYQEAIELFTEVRFQYATSMCMYRCAGCAFCYPLNTFVFTTGGRPRLPGRGQKPREHRERPKEHGEV